jgi:glycosyltransferase involved in cell wall biosynthesis
MKNVLCLSDSLDDISNFVKGCNLSFFQIEQLDPEQRKWEFFDWIYQELKGSLDLSRVDLIIAEYVEAIPLVYFMRKEGYFCPTIFIPHMNPYPLNILFYFLLVSQYSHPQDVVLCGSQQAVNGYNQFVNIHALPICTFGIKNQYRKGDKNQARKELALPLKGKILLYTGRFMNDKALLPLFEAYEEMKKRMKNLSLVLSVNHIDCDYFNSLAPRMRDVILFYRLAHEKMNLLYQSSDLFVSAATSVFETYGKSPLEAISSGIPAVVPKWDGFHYFITPNNGALANIFYCDLVEDSPFSFAQVDIKDFVDKCCSWLTKNESAVDASLPPWAYYHHTMDVLTEMVQTQLTKSGKFYKQISNEKEIDFSSYPAIIQDICSHYDIHCCKDMEIHSEKWDFNADEISLLRKFHHALFQVMESSPENILEECGSLSSIS